MRLCLMSRSKGSMTSLHEAASLQYVPCQSTTGRFLFESPFCYRASGNFVLDLNQIGQRSPPYSSAGHSPKRNIYFRSARSSWCCCDKPSLSFRSNIFLPACHHFPLSSESCRTNLGCPCSLWAVPTSFDFWDDRGGCGGLGSNIVARRCWLLSSALDEGPPCLGVCGVVFDIWVLTNGCVELPRPAVGVVGGGGG